VETATLRSIHVMMMIVIVAICFFNQSINQSLLRQKAEHAETQ